MAASRKPPATKPTPLRVSTPYDNGTLHFEPIAGKWVWEGRDAQGASIRTSSSTSSGLRTRIEALFKAASKGTASAPPPAPESCDVLAMHLHQGSAIRSGHSIRPAQPSPSGTGWVTATPVLVRLQRAADGSWRPVRYLETTPGSSWQSRGVENMVLVVPDALDDAQRAWLAARCVRSCMQEHYSAARARILDSVTARPSVGARFSTAPLTGVMTRLPADATGGSSSVSVPSATPLPEVSIKALAEDLDGWAQMPSGVLEKAGVTIGFKSTTPGYLATSFTVTTDRWGPVAESDSWADAMVLANRTVAALAAAPTRVWNIEGRETPKAVEVHASAVVRGSVHRSGQALYLLQRDIEELDLARAGGTGSQRNIAAPRWQHLYRSYNEQHWAPVLEGDERLTHAVHALDALLATSAPDPMQDGVDVSHRQAMQALAPSVQAAASAVPSGPASAEAVQALRNSWKEALETAASAARVCPEVAAFAVQVAAIDASWQSPGTPVRSRKPGQA